MLEGLLGKYGQDDIDTRWGSYTTASTNFKWVLIATVFSVKTGKRIDSKQAEQLAREYRITV
ncbi:hypothetical protein HW44_10145 [Nitrosococcus oceani]|nr:hypothetical protein HW44_10145 [Nitrosococcus oceani]